jgi:hypothetical protein
LKGHVAGGHRFDAGGNGAISLIVASAQASDTTNAAQTFALETFARRSLNYYNRMVDSNGLPYFNIFWTDPAQTAHDWPDFGDVMSRQYQGAVMARHVTGERAAIEADGGKLQEGLLLRHGRAERRPAQRPAARDCH